IGLNKGAPDPSGQTAAHEERHESEMVPMGRVAVHLVTGIRAFAARSGRWSGLRLLGPCGAQVYVRPCRLPGCADHHPQPAHLGGGHRGPECEVPVTLTCAVAAPAARPPFVLATQIVDRADRE